MVHRLDSGATGDERKEQVAARKIHFELDSNARDVCPFDGDVLNDNNSLAHSDETCDESTQARGGMSRQSSIQSTTAMRLRWTVIFLFCLMAIAVPLIIYFAVRDGKENAIIPLLCAFVVFGAFFVVAFLALAYDQITQQHLECISSSERAARRVAYNFYPEGVQDAAFGNQKERGSSILHPKMKLKNFLIDNEDDDNQELLAKPIADLYTSCTVCFANITGFTAWSSEREPQQVFLLLETVFGVLDKIAKRSRVFKVETGKDCYRVAFTPFQISTIVTSLFKVGETFIAVTGLPDRQADHAIRMTRFALVCMAKANRAFERLETTLGPDTGDLRLRFGLHSGPVTAG
jgi:class 3 adenylate cyclase